MSLIVEYNIETTITRSGENDMKTKLINWFEKRKKVHQEKMMKLGKCPDCRGYGVVIVPIHYAGSNIECYKCNGTGKFSEWEKNTQ